MVKGIDLKVPCMSKIILSCVKIQLDYGICIVCFDVFNLLIFVHEC